MITSMLVSVSKWYGPVAVTLIYGNIKRTLILIKSVF